MDTKTTTLILKLLLEILDELMFPKARVQNPIFHTTREQEKRKLIHEVEQYIQNRAKTHEIPKQDPHNP